MKDYYALLGVGPEASPEEIRRAYRDRAANAMWDRPRFSQLSEAWEILKDPERRDVYTREWRTAYATAGAAADAGAGAAAPSHPGSGSSGARVFGGNDAAGATGTGPQQGAAGVTANAASSGGAKAFGATAMGGGAAAGATIAPPPPSPSPPAGNPTMAMGGATQTGERTRQVHLPPCPICATPGVPGETFCPECGFLVGSTPGPDASAGERPLPFLVDTRNGQQYPLRRGENVVGRERGDVVIADGTVSRRHARLFVQTDGELLVEDLGSTNGTKRAGVPLPAGQRAAVGDGTTIQIGAVKLAVSIPDAPLALPLPAAAPDSSAPANEEAPVAALAAPQGVESVARFVGPGEQEYKLTETTTTFGRRSTNHFVLTADPYVSGAHAQVVFAAETGFRVVDLGSTNGTSVNGRRLAPNTPEPIKNGDEVTLGRTKLRFFSPV